MLINIGDIAITSLDRIMAFDYVTDDFAFELVELQDAKISNTEDKGEVTGKQGRKLTNIKRNKAVAISGTHGLVSGGLLEVQTGSQFVNYTSDSDDKAVVMYRDIIKIGADKTATTTYTAIGTAGNEITEVRIIKNDAEVKRLKASDGAFTYASASKKLTFTESDDVTEGDTIQVHYYREVTGSVLENLSDSYSGKVSMFIDAQGEDMCGNIYHVQFHIPKADFSGNFDLELGGDQVTHAFEAESLAGTCDSNGYLWTYTVFTDAA